MDPKQPTKPWWRESCAATECIRERFGLKNALDYIVGQKLIDFVSGLEWHPDDAVDLPQFIAEVQRLFTEAELRDYLDELRRRPGGTHRYRAMLRWVRPRLLYEDADRS